MQRSCGYADRPTLAVAEIQHAVVVIKHASPGCLVLVDNCYGEFTEPLEPCAVRSAAPHSSPPSPSPRLDAGAQLLGHPHNCALTWEGRSHPQHCTSTDLRLARQW